MWGVNLKRLSSVMVVFLCNGGMMKGSVGVLVLFSSYDCTHNNLNARDQRGEKKRAHPVHQLFLSLSLSISLPQPSPAESESSCLYLAKGNNPNSPLQWWPVDGHSVCTAKLRGIVEWHISASRTSLFYWRSQCVFASSAVMILLGISISQCN